MPDKIPSERQWLQAEQSGQDELAEAMFARVIAGMPAVEPSADFVTRTVQAAWLARRRRRRVARVALAAAALLIATVGAGSIYELAPLATNFAVRAAVLLSHALIWFLTSATAGARWWWIADRIGTVVRESIAAPSTAAAFAAIEVMALAAIFAFQRLLGRELQQRKAR